jgi:hypothetical protein
VVTKFIGGILGGELVLLRPIMALVKTTNNYEGKLGGGESIVPGEVVVVQWASPGLSPLYGHVVSLDEQKRDGLGRLNRQAQGKNVVGDPWNSPSQGKEKARSRRS